MLDAFRAAGWAWEFKKTGKATGGFVDLILFVVNGDKDARRSSELSATVRERKRFHATDPNLGGFWQGGVPPFPAIRLDWTTKKPLADGEHVQEQHRVVLGKGPSEWLSTWERAADLVLEGWSYGRSARCSSRRTRRWVRRCWSGIVAPSCAC